MSNEFTIVAKQPCQCSPIELEDFIALVQVGGEVVNEGLEDRVKYAECLVCLKENDCLVGVAALKNPREHYRRSISKNAKIAIKPVEFPFELGYIFVLPSSRRKGYSVCLVNTALSEANGKGVFATSRVTNEAMHKTLYKYKFEKVGRVYPSENGKEKIQLFLRRASNIESSSN